MSLSALLALLGSAFVFANTSLIQVSGTAVLIVMTVEAILRRRLAAFLLGVSVLAAIAGIVFLLVTNLRVALGVLLLLAALALLIANLRAYLGRR